MLKVLPLKAVWPEDSLILGEEIALLAKLRQTKFPVPDGIVISVPRDEIKAILERGQWVDSAAFEQHFNEIKRQILKIEQPVELSQLLANKKIKVAELWQRLLREWLDELRGASHRGVKFPVKVLETKYCLFTGVIKVSGKAYFDRANQDTEIVIETGKLTAPVLKDLNDMVIKLKNVWLKDYVYHWVLDNTLQITRVVPYSDQELVAPEPKIAVGNLVWREPALPVTATKVYWSLDSLVIDPRCDGVMLAAETTAGVEELRFKLIEAAHSYPGKEVILRFGNYPTDFGVGGGCFELLKRKEVLEREVEAVLYARNKRQLLNVSVGLPTVRSVAELMEIKRTLAAIGVTRKGSMKLWMEIGLPENLVNFDQYAMVGIDGVIVNLASLQAWLGGFKPDASESAAYQQNYQSLGLFLESMLKKVTKLRLPILVTGRPLQAVEIVKILVKLGVWGVLPHPANSDEIRWQLSKLERSV